MPVCALTITAALWGQKAARDRAAAMPFQASKSIGPVSVGGASAQTEPAVIRMIVGQDWTITQSNRWWASWQITEFRVNKLRITDEHGNPISRPFPVHDARNQILRLRNELGVPASISVRTTGWPWKSWVWMSGRTYSPAERTWQPAIVREEPILLGIAMTAAASAILGWSVTTFAWAVFLLFRRAIRTAGNRCAVCGYELSGRTEPNVQPKSLHGDNSPGCTEQSPQICPECGSSASPIMRQQSRQ